MLNVRIVRRHHALTICVLRILESVWIAVAVLRFVNAHIALKAITAQGSTRVALACATVRGVVAVQQEMVVARVLATTGAN